jgi:hypothetical protein
MITGDGDGAAAISDVAARRLANQLSRAFRGTYGARTGLRTIVRSVARQMLAGGASHAAIARALEDSVLNHPAREAGDQHTAVTDKSHSLLLIELTRECVAEAAVEATAS